MNNQIVKLEGLFVNLFELHVALREDHKALCDCLFSADLLKRSDLVEVGRARRVAARVKDVLEVPRLAHALGMAAGISATDRLGAVAKVGSKACSALSEAERKALLEARVPTPRRGTNLQELLRTPKVALELGCSLGVATTRRVARTSRAYGEGMRTALPRVASRLPPGIFAFGGYDSAKAAVDLVERFDPAMSSWEMLPSMPSLRAGCGVARVDGLIYVVGGHRGVVGERCLSTCERFDPTMETWEVLPQMHASRHTCSACGHRGTLFVIGAEGEDSSMPITGESYTPAHRRWERLPAWRFTEFRRCQLASALGRIYIVCAKAGCHIVLCFNEDSQQWEALPSKPVGMDGYEFNVATASNDTLYIVGRVASGPVCERLDFASQQWERLMLKGWCASGSPRSMCAVAGRLYILSDSWCPDAEHFQAEGVIVNLSTGRCQAWIPPLPTARIECGLVAAWR